MEKFKRLALFGALYTTLIAILYYALAAFFANGSTAMSPRRFFTILLFGYIISLTETFVSAFKVKKLFSFLIYYFVLLFSFLFIFVIGGGIKINGAGTIFAIVIIYTAFYAVSAGAVTLIKKSLNPKNKKTATNTSTK